MCETDCTYKSPPINKIIKFFQAKGICDHAVFKLSSEPVIAFELFDQGNLRRRTPFYEQSMETLKRRAPQEIEAEAERRRQEFNALYGGNWIVVQTWNLYFEEIPI